MQKTAENILHLWPPNRRKGFPLHKDKSLSARFHEIDETRTIFAHVPAFTPPLLLTCHRDNIVRNEHGAHTDALIVIRDFDPLLGIDGDFQMDRLFCVDDRRIFPKLPELLFGAQTLRVSVDTAERAIERLGDNTDLSYVGFRATAEDGNTEIAHLERGTDCPPPGPFNFSKKYPAPL